MSVSCHFVIPAAGRGLRFGGDLPKQYQLLLGKPIIVHTIEAVKPFAKEIILVLNIDDFVLWESLVKKYPVLIDCKTVAGGKTRFESVKNALSHCSLDSLVAIHDAVRPLIARDTLRSLILTAKKEGSAVPYQLMKDSVRQLYSSNNLLSSKAVDRSCFVTVQTPQIFRLDLIRKAYDLDYKDTFTDDCSVYEAYMGKSPVLVEDPFPNFKITLPTDIIIAEALLRHK